RSARSGERDAQMSPAPPSTISRACAGPPTHATRADPKARSNASVGGVPSGGTRPFVNDTTPACGTTWRVSSAIAASIPEAGTATNTRSERWNWSSWPPSARTFRRSGRRTPGGRQASALRGDGPALDAVRRRDLEVDGPALESLAPVRVQLLEHVVRELVDLRRAHVAPHERELERDLVLDSDVVRGVVARRVPGGEDARELVERVLAVGLRVRLVPVADEDVDGGVVVGVELGARREATARDLHHVRERAAHEEPLREHLAH